MTNVPVTDADREAAYTLDALIGTVFNSPSSPQIVEWCEQAIARARAEEREACAKHVIDSRSCNVGHSFQPSQCEECYWFDSIAAAIRARSEGGKA